VRRKSRNPAQRLRLAVDALPRRTRVAMLRGIAGNDVAVGAYKDKASGAICPMLAAHRHGGRTNLASFARAWDRFTGARRPRLATGREVRALTSYLELSLLRDEQGESLTSIATRIRSQRERVGPERDDADTGAPAAPGTAHRPGDPDRAPELRRRRRWSWLLPVRRYDVFTERVAAAQEQLSEQRAGALATGAGRDSTGRAHPGRGPATRAHPGR
jgi:hypothetical protein